MRYYLLALITFGFVACGGDGGGSGVDAPNGGGDDAPSSIDSPPVPTMITISGTASSRGIGSTTPVVGATVGAFANTDETTPVGMATTDAQGMYSIVITTSGSALDGFVKATKTGLVDTYVYPTAPISADQVAPVNMVTPGNYDTLSTLAQGNQMDQNGLIALIIQDAAAMPVAGATVSSTPAASVYRYNGANGLPSSQTTSTQADGTAYMFNMPPGAATVSATKTGLTFKTHGLNVHALALTTTLVTE
jgi:hypothetical protein